MLNDMQVYERICSSIAFIMRNRQATERQKIVAMAVGHMMSLVGVREDPKGSDKGPYIDALRDLVDGSVGAWCSQSACGSLIRGADLYSQLSGERWVLDSVEDGSVSGLWRANLAKFPSFALPQPFMEANGIHPMIGDLMIRSDDKADMLAGGRGKRNHTGLVGMYDPIERMLYNVEGNTNEAGESNNGGEFCIKNISFDDARLVGFVRPQFRKA